MEETKKQIRAFILKEFLPGEDPANLADDTQLISGRVLDSLATLKVVAYLEETFGIEVAAHEADVSNLDTVNDMAALVQSKKVAS